ncbi:hypothetical protein PATY110618_05460 [Paenibacillus typhae]|uniref:Uncharacterized protein n=1 Tax=Paenibacillus typhae TaxID=1174501 RepID=A0A1G8NH38_9BACL|nr:hypothetical protein SAMN05216192_108141 [Paenibacillus typhae]
MAVVSDPGEQLFPISGVPDKISVSPSVYAEGLFAPYSLR